MIRFDKVSFGYRGEEEKKCLSDFDLSIAKGECVLLCGPSGCGKSTVIRMVNGLIPRFYEGNIGGSVEVNGKIVADAELYENAKIVGTVFQNPRSQFFNVDTTSELVLGCENMGMPEEEILRRKENTIQLSNIQKLMDRSIFELSGGEKQKIACASVMTVSPEVIVLDEPSANLDYDAICDLQRMIELWKKQGKTILIAEHRLSYCLPYVNRVVVMAQGKIKNIYSQIEFEELDSEHLHSMGLRSTENKNAKCMNMKEQIGATMTVYNLCFGYEKDKMILDYEKMGIPIGEIVAIVGTNGVGKTTFLRCLCGMEKRCKAVLEYDGKKYKNKQRLNLMYLVMQDVNHQLFTESVLDEVLISMKEENEEKALEILTELDLREFAERHPVSLSGGEKQRVAVASAIASDRDIILFDEPTSGLDYRHMMQVANLMKKLRAMGKTVLVVTHDVELIENCCTRVILLEDMNKVKETA